MKELPTPAALLLDFGGVIVSSTARSGWVDEVTDRITGLPGAGILPPAKTIRDELEAGTAAVKAWRNAMSRPRQPFELTHEQYVDDFLFSDFAPQQREFLMQYATQIAYWVSDLSEVREFRPGIVQLLQLAREKGTPVVIVSNAQCGQVHRDILEGAGMSIYFKAQLYSDEVGVRKPNPRFIIAGAERAGVDVSECWYVGDHYDRDVLAGARAGVGASILMRDVGTGKRPFTTRVEPALAVADPVELHRVFEELVDSRSTK